MRGEPTAIPTHEGLQQQPAEGIPRMKTSTRDVLILQKKGHQQNAHRRFPSSQEYRQAASPWLQH